MFQHPTETIYLGKNNKKDTVVIGCPRKRFPSTRPTLNPTK